MKRLVVTFALLAALPAAAQPRFSASAVDGVGIGKPGRVLISNQGRTITAHHFHGNIRESLVRLQSRATPLTYRPFGPELFDSSAAVRREVPAPVAKAIGEAAKEHGVDPRLLAEIARWESGFQPTVVSRAGARGVMQLMPATAAYLGVRDAFDIRDNIRGGTKYLRELLDTFRGDLDLTLAAYNAGPGAVERWGGVPPYRETEQYVRGIRAAYERAIQ